MRGSQLRAMTPSCGSSPATSFAHRSMRGSAAHPRARPVPRTRDRSGDVWPAAKGAVESSATVPCDPTSAMTLHQACLYPATRRTTLDSSSVREHEFPDLIDRLPAKRRVSVSNNSFKRVGHTSLLSCTKASSVWELLLLHVSARGLRYAVVYKSIFGGRLLLPSHRLLEPAT